MAILRWSIAIVAAVVTAVALAGAAAGQAGVRLAGDRALPVDPARSVVIVQTYATLPGSGYPWVQPVWVFRRSTVLPTAPYPAVASLDVQPTWVVVGHVTVPRLR